MKVRIEIDTKTFVRFWLVVICFGLAGLMIYSASTALALIGTAFFLALALNGPVAKLARVLPGKSRLGGTALAFVMIIVVITAVVWFVVPPLVEQSLKFAETIPALVDRAKDEWVGVNAFIEHNNLQPQVDAALASIQQQASSWAASIGTNILGSVGSLASFFVAFFLVIVLSFLMLLEGPAWMDRLWMLYRDKKKMEHHKKLLGKMYTVVTGYVTGQLTVSAIGALAAGACVFILSFVFTDIPANLAMPTILLTFILALIPMFGSTLAGTLVGLLLLFNNVTAAIVYVIFFIAYQQIENNFISPTIQSKKLELSALAVLVAVTVGIYVGGLAGGVIAIPIAGSIKVLLEDYLEQRSALDAVENSKPLKKLVRKFQKEKQPEA